MEVVSYLAYAALLNARATMTQFRLCLIDIIHANKWICTINYGATLPLQVLLPLVHTTSVTNATSTASTVARYEDQCYGIPDAVAVHSSLRGLQQASSY